MTPVDIAALRARFDARATEPDTRLEIGNNVDVTLCGGFFGGWCIFGDDCSITAQWPEWVALAEGILGVSRAEMASLLAEAERLRAIEAATRRYLDADDECDADINSYTSEARWTARDVLCEALGRGR